jgi:hypothetical protein
MFYLPVAVTLCRNVTCDAALQSIGAKCQAGRKALAAMVENERGG